MGGHVDCYLDCSSFYSYLTLVHLLKNRAVLATHEVTVEFHPIFLGGVNQGSGNKPPWTLPAKAKYGKFDSERAKQYHKMTKIEVPAFFPPVTLLGKPQRAICFIKAHYPPSTFEEAWLALFHDLWTPPQSNITEPDDLSSCLSSTKLFSSKEVEQIIAAAGEKRWKDQLLSNTQKVLSQGAFGAPWMWVRNGDGVEEPFFGSDRFHFMWEFLGLPWKDIEVVPKGEAKAKM